MEMARALCFISLEDAVLIELYRQFSDDRYCAQWMGEAEEYADEFKEWLLDVWRFRDGNGLTSYEQESINVLREAFNLAKSELAAELEVYRW